MHNPTLTGQWSFKDWDTSATIYDEEGDYVADVSLIKSAELIVAQHNAAVMILEAHRDDAIKARDAAINQMAALSRKAGFFDGLNWGLAEALKAILSSHREGNQHALDKAMEHAETVLATVSREWRG